MKYVSVSLEGDRELTKHLDVLAKRQNTTVGTLVRQAIEQCYRPQLDVIASFFANSDTRTNRSVRK